MGTKSPENIPAVEWRRLAETVGEMIAHRWEVRSYCPACHTYLETELRFIVQTTGPDTSLWNRQARCRRRLHGGAVPCNGRVRFEARPRQRVTYFVLEAPWPPGKEPAQKKGPSSDRGAA